MEPIQQGYFDLFTDQRFWVMTGSYILFSNAVSALPMPDEKSGKVYIFFFRLLNGVANNISRILASKNPGSDNQPPSPLSSQASKDKDK